MILAIISFWEFAFIYALFLSLIALCVILSVNISDKRVEVKRNTDRNIKNTYGRCNCNDDFEHWRKDES